MVPAHSPLLLPHCVLVPLGWRECAEADAVGGGEGTPQGLGGDLGPPQSWSVRSGATADLGRLRPRAWTLSQSGCCCLDVYYQHREAQEAEGPPGHRVQPENHKWSIPCLEGTSGSPWRDTHFTAPPALPPHGVRTQGLKPTPMCAAALRN